MATTKKAATKRPRPQKVENPCPNCGRAGEVAIDGVTVWCSADCGIAYPSDALVARRASEEEAARAAIEAPEASEEEATV